MKALILAAGLGTRLRPLTDETPKALLPVGGVPLLERAARRLAAAGAQALVVNAHHRANLVEAFCAGLSRRLGLPVLVSREDELLLDTGGAVKKAAPLLAGGSFIVHNADAVSDLDLGRLLAAHEKSGALATLACRERATQRPLFFDAAGRLAGRRTAAGPQWTRGEPAAYRSFGFDGVAAYSPAMLSLIEEDGAFPIWRPLLRLAGEGRAIGLFRADGSIWFNVGTPEKLAAAERWAAERAA